MKIGWKHFTGGSPSQLGKIAVVDEKQVLREKLFSPGSWPSVFKLSHKIQVPGRAAFKHARLGTPHKQHLGLGGFLDLGFFWACVHAPLRVPGTM